MTFPPIIGFCGYARVGKNTAAEELKKLLVKRSHLLGYADPLKADLAACVEWFKNIGIDTTTDAFKEKFRPMYVLWSRIAKEITGDETVWVNRRQSEIDYIKYCDKIPFLTDVRYWYEIESILAQGGMVFFIRRNGVGPKNEEEENSFHLIEQRYMQLTRDFAVYNNGTKEELGQNVMKLLKLNLDSM